MKVRGYVLSWPLDRATTEFPNNGRGVHIGVGSTMKYLGLVLESRWTFEEHFRRLAPKLDRSGAALKRLLPNLGDPDAPCRRLYAGIVRSKEKLCCRDKSRYEEWLERSHGVLSFGMTQVLTGHGKFGRFLHRPKEERTPGCRHCVDHRRTRCAPLGRSTAVSP
ncbi:hypothetical protein PYW07_015747 [Mythimna separata]|uniref:Uncharacterized protein n=1 Tax=Mythimna separata TaxID=271217 RepID=A0AAD7YPX0_MYTSE|nr:hypothetical protein PYW07_015747 [Mythimna separata]